ncbi:hypothetical protein CRE_16987 [Caenorhabditis remanei]|uniref:CUT domain-containing protein n=1 Tax=Caenorhabditis remanei TaxID=31234 RepID=E3N2F4_CAERE|nr:hypothetical protein CRE_16987 [Caenorhabditis remanei]
MDDMYPENLDNQPGEMGQNPPHFFPNPPPQHHQEPPFMNPNQPHNATGGLQPSEYERMNINHLAFARDYVMLGIQQNPVLPYHNPHQFIPLAQVPDDQSMRPEVGIHNPNYNQNIQERQPNFPAPEEDIFSDADKEMLEALQRDYPDEHQVEPTIDAYENIYNDQRDVPAERDAQSEEPLGNSEYDEEVLAGPSSTSQHSTSPPESSRQNQALDYVEQLNKMHKTLNTKKIARKFIQWDGKYPDNRIKLAMTIHTDLDYFNAQIKTPVDYDEMNNEQKVMYSRLNNLLRFSNEVIVTILELYEEMVEAWTQKTKKKSGKKYAQNEDASNDSGLDSGNSARPFDRTQSVSREEALKVSKQLDEPTESVDTRDVAKRVKHLISLYVVDKTPIATMIGVDLRDFKKHFIDIEDPKKYSEMKGAQKNIFRRLHNWLDCDDAERRNIMNMREELRNARGKDTRKWENRMKRKSQVQQNPGTDDNKSISLVKVSQTYLLPTAEPKTERILEIVKKLSKSLEDEESIDKNHLTEQFRRWTKQWHYSKLRDILGIGENYQFGAAITKCADKYQQQVCLRFHNWLKEEERMEMLDYHKEVRKVWETKGELIMIKKERGMEEQEPLAKKRKRNDTP